MKIKILKKYPKLTDSNIDTIEKILAEKEKRLVKYEQTQPYCVHNGRKWQMGKKKKNSRNFGHLKGVETVKKIVRASIKLNVSIVTFYVFQQRIGKDQKLR